MHIVTTYTPPNIIFLLFPSPWPSKIRLVADVVKSVGITAKVLLPTTKVPEACKSTGVPAIVMPGPPAVIVVPSIEIAVGLGVKASLPTVNAVGKAWSAEKDIVLPPTSKRPEEPKLTCMPAIATPGPPAVIVMPSIDIAVGLGVKTSLPTVNTVGKGWSAKRDIVLLPTIKRPEEPKLTCVPSIVKPEPPAVSGGLSI